MCDVPYCGRGASLILPLWRSVCARARVLVIYWPLNLRPIVNAQNAVPDSFVCRWICAPSALSLHHFTLLVAQKFTDSNARWCARKPVFRSTIRKYAFYYATCSARKNYIVNCCRRIRRRRQRLGLVEYGSHYPHLFSSNSQLHHSHILFISNILYYRTVWLRRKDDITWRWHPSFFGESSLNEPKTAHHLPKWFGECNEKNRNDMVKRIANAENKRFFAVSFSSHQYRSLTSFFGVVGFFHRLCVLGIGEQRWTRRIYMFFQHSVYFSETNGVWIYQR